MRLDVGVEMKHNEIQLAPSFDSKMFKTRVFPNKLKVIQSCTVKAFFVLFCFAISKHCLPLSPSAGLTNNTVPDFILLADGRVQQGATLHFHVKWTKVCSALAFSLLIKIRPTKVSIYDCENPISSCILK